MVLAAGLPGCSGNGQIDQQTATAVGMVVGGIAGNVIGGGSRGGRIAGTIIGAAIGGMIAYEIAKSLNEQDRRIAHNRYAIGLSQGKPGEKFTWANPASGASTTYTPQQSRPAKVQQRIVKPTNVQAPPSLTIIGENYVAPKPVDVRVSPSTSGAVSAKLAAKDSVTVLGKLDDQPWYLVGRDGAAIGYVPATSLMASKEANPTATIVTAVADQSAATPAAGYTVADVPSTTTCRDLDYEVFVNGQKAEANRFDACKTVDGNWLVRKPSV